MVWYELHTNDSWFFSLADHTSWTEILKNELPVPYFLLGDSAFTCIISMITPGNYDDFNFDQSSLRINIKCSFGALIRRWGILWRPLEMEILKGSAVIGCYIGLHNYCIESRIILKIKWNYLITSGYEAPCVTCKQKRNSCQQSTHRIPLW